MAGTLWETAGRGRNGLARDTFMKAAVKCEGDHRGRPLVLCLPAGWVTEVKRLKL